MDAYIISIIVSYTPYRRRKNLRQALSGYILPEDEKAFFDVDIHTLSARNLRLYLWEHGDKHNCREILASIIDRKIFIEKSLWSKVTRYVSGNDCHKLMKAEYDGASKHEWLINNPDMIYHEETPKYGRLIALDKLPQLTRYISALHENTNYTMQQILEVFIRHRISFYDVPDEFNTDKVPDEIFRLYRTAVKHKLCTDCFGSDLTKRLIIEMSEMVYDVLTFDGHCSVASYVLARYPNGTQLDDVPTSAIGEAFKLYRRYN